MSLVACVKLIINIIIIIIFAHHMHVCYMDVGTRQDHPDDRPVGLPHGAQGQPRAIHGKLGLL